MQRLEFGNNKVLVITYYFPPMGGSGVQRIVKFLKYFREFNWEATVLTISPKGYYFFDNQLLKEVEEMNIKIVRTNSKDPTQLLLNPKQNKLPNEFVRKLMNRISQVFFLPDNKRSWLKEAVKVGKKLLAEEHFDVIFATAPPFTVLRIGVELRKAFNVPLVVDYRDAWLENEFSFYPTPIHKFIVKRMEYNVLKNSDKVITYTRLLKEDLLQKYKFLKFDDVKIIPHGFDSDDFPKTFVSTKTKGKMRITYSGLFYEHRKAKYFIYAINKLFYEHPELANKIELCFVGHLGKHNERLIKKLKLTNSFNILNYLEHKEAVKYIVDSDILWFTLGDIKKARLIATAKVFEYFGTRKPILGLVPEGAASNILNEYKAARVVHPKDIDGIKNAVLNFYDEYVANKLPVPDEEFVKKFERRNLTYELVKEFQFLLAE